MELTHNTHGGLTTARVTGRLDAYWAEQLETDLEELVRGGAHNLHLDLSDVTFLSSTGIRVLIRYAQQLSAIGGSLAVVSASDTVREVLELSGLQDLLGTPAGLDEVETGTAELREICAGSAQLMVSGQAQPLACRLSGDPSALASGAFTPEDFSTIGITPTTVALGIGGIAEKTDGHPQDAGEFLAMGGAALWLPTGPHAAPDYMLGAEAFQPTASALYALRCSGELGLTGNFAPREPDRPALLSDIAEGALDACGAHQCVIAAVAETTGLVGAALKRSPAADSPDGDLFEHPQVRDWLSFTPEPIHDDALVLVVGVAARKPDRALGEFVRPLRGKGDIVGHFHAAALSYRALPRTMPDLPEIVADLLQTQSIRGIMHLLPDLREGFVGGGESEFARGTLWFAPIEVTV